MQIKCNITHSSTRRQALFEMLFMTLARDTWHYISIIDPAMTRTLCWLFRGDIGGRSLQGDNLHCALHFQGPSESCIFSVICDLMYRVQSRAAPCAIGASFLWMTHHIASWPITFLLQCTRFPCFLPVLPHSITLSSQIIYSSKEMALKKEKLTDVTKAFILFRKHTKLKKRLLFQGR